MVAPMFITFVLNVVMDQEFYWQDQVHSWSRDTRQLCLCGRIVWIIQSACLWLGVRSFYVCSTNSVLQKRPS